MNSSKRRLSLGLATALLMSAVATTFGTQMAATPGKQVSMTAKTTASTTDTKRQRTMARRHRQRPSAHTLKVSAKKTKRVPNAKSLSKLSY